jgi:type II secretory pathway component PulK
MRSLKKTQRGIVMVSVFLLLTVLLVLGGTLVVSAVADIRAAQRIEASLQALYLAEAGIDQAIVQLRQDPEWAGDSAEMAGGTYTIRDIRR